jgi:AcrR family transcriptional regulator
MPEVAPPQAAEITHAPAQMRVLEGALRLFAVHGISGTSLQMIADAIGVTKAAVYHQYKAKDDIVLAIAELVIAGLEVILSAAESERTAARRRDALIRGLSGLAVESRHMAGILQQDPVMLRCLQDHERFRQVMGRLELVLTAGKATPAARVRAALVVTAIAGAVIHPLTQTVDAQVLGSELSRQLGKLYAPSSRRTVR